MDPFEARASYEGLSVLSWFYQATHIQVSLFSHSSLIRRFAGEMPDLNLPMFLQTQLPKKLPPVWFASMDENVLFAGIQPPQMDMQVIFGPVLPFDCRPTQARRLVSLMGRSMEDAPRLMAYFRETGPVAQDSLLSAIHLLACIFPLSNESPFDLQIEQIPYSYEPPFPPQPVKEREARNRRDYLLERRLLSFVRQGQTEPFEDMLQTSQILDRPREAPAPMHPQYITTAMTLASRAAIDAGVDADLVFVMLEEFLDRLSRANRPEEYGRLFPESFLAFTREVRRLREAQPEDALCRKVHRYIYGHLHEKITPTKIADALDYNVSYLCRHFKKEMHTTIAAYANTCKIREAKRLLEQTDTPLIEIAEQMGYPSLSYFGQVFKEQTGVTPRQWRKQGRI